MAITSITHAEKQSEMYPKLMVGKTSGTIILFSAPSVGSVVYSAFESLGKHATTWNMPDFEDFTGSVTLRNGA